MTTTLQAKAYARAQGRPQTWEERDRGYLSSWYNYWTSVRVGSGLKHAQDIRIVLTLLYISLNISILLVFMVAGNQCQEKLTALSFTQSSHIYLMAVLIGMTSFNTTYILSFVCGLISNYPTVWATMKGSQSLRNPPIPTGTSVYKDEEITLILKYITLPVTVIIELFLAMKVHDNPRFPLPSLTVKLCCCCCRCCSLRLKYKTFQVLIWWNVMVFIQILVGQVALPVLILFAIAPATTISVIGTAALVHIYFMIAILYFVQIVRYHCSWKKCGFAFAELLGLIVFLVLLASLLYFYLEVLRAGSSLTGIKGLVFSLIPSVVLSLTAWAIKKRLSRGRNNKILMESAAGDRAHDWKMEEGRVFDEEQKNLLQSESESEKF